jgi:hypothetical protein
MRTLRFVVALVAAGTSITGGAAVAADSSTATVVVSVQFSSRTSLHVSTDTLQFDVSTPGDAATAAIDFSAAARTHTSAEVLLSVEQVRGVAGSGGARDIESALTFAGQGNGTVGGALSAVAPAVAARWTGSGLRAGHLVFSLRTCATGRYVVPVRFVLSAP